MIEYALLLMLVGAVVVALLASIGRGASAAFCSTGQGINSKTWCQAAPQTSPAARSGAAMALDPVSHHLVMFGGRLLDGSSPTDMWTWDGANWRSLTPLTVPPGRFQAQMALDPVSNKVLLYGGIAADPRDLSHRRLDLGRH